MTSVDNVLPSPPLTLPPPLLDVLVGGPFVFACPRCPLITLSAHRLREHALTEHQGRLTYLVNVCSVCMVNSTEHDVIKRHMEAAHQGGVILAQHVELNTIPLQRPPSIPGMANSSCSSTVAAMEALLKAALPLGTSTPGSHHIPMTAMEAQQSSADLPVVHNWARLIARQDKKFLCLLCNRTYPGRTEAVFHTVVKHLLQDSIARDLSNLCNLSEETRGQIRRYFTGGMRIKSGIHYKNAEMVEAALFLSIEIHLRQSGSHSNPTYTCSQCRLQFNDLTLAYLHMQDKLRDLLPPFMRSRSCPWSLHTREEWIWLVPEDPSLLPPPPSDPSDLSTAALLGPDLAPRICSPEEMGEMEQEEERVDEVEFCEWMDTTDLDEDIHQGIGKLEHQDSPLQSEEDEKDFHGQLTPEDLVAKENLLDTVYITSSSNGYVCSLCPESLYPSESLARDHVVEDHLEVRVATCAHCDFTSDQRGVKAHCSREHMDMEPGVVLNKAYSSLHQGIRVHIQH